MEYLNGWYREETAEELSFRWMEQEAECLVKEYPRSGRKYVCFKAGHSFFEDIPPNLCVFANNIKLGQRKINAAFSAYAFPLEDMDPGEIKLEFKLDRFFNVPNDGRKLGIMISDLKILMLEDMEKFSEGWYLPETDSLVHSRWMEKQALCVLGPLPNEERAYLQVLAGHPYPEAENPELTVSIQGKEKTKFEIFPGKKKYILPLEKKAGFLEVQMKLDQIFDQKTTGDSRDLGINVESIELKTANEIEPFFEGWNPPETSASSEKEEISRWMKRKAVYMITGLTPGKERYLTVKAGHPYESQKNPKLSVTVNEEFKGDFEIPYGEKSYLIPLGLCKDYIKLDLELNKSFTPVRPGDERELGMLVMGINANESSDIEIFFDGWYPPETSDKVQPKSISRWMKQEAFCIFSGLPENKRRYLKIVGGHPFSGDDDPFLAVRADGSSKGELKFTQGEKKYIVPLGETSDFLQVDLTTDRTFKSGLEGDERELGVLVKNIEMVSLDQNEVLIEQGWQGWRQPEKDNFFNFNWISRQASLYISPHQIQTFKYISFYVFSEFVDFSQILKLILNEADLIEIPLLHKWNYYSFLLKPTTQNIGSEELTLELALNKAFPHKFHEDDDRELGIRIAEVRFHNDDEEHENFLEYHRNAVLNFEEMEEGKAELSSFPMNLGIDLYGKCNISPPCVYCLWDSMKDMEGDYKDTNVDEKTLEEYGAFFKSARTLVNCSFGEPLLHPRLKEILDLCAKNKKFLELSTNGQAFTKRTIEALVGKPIFLYVSLDAARKETYAKIRNDKWDPIVPNLELLNRERKKYNNFPKLNMVFMPMKVNRDDLEDYFRLCKKIDADALVIRPLLYLFNPKIEKDRGGYFFNYKDELLPREELEVIFRKCEEYSEKYGVPLANQFEFGKIQEPGSKKDSEFYFEFQRS